MLFRSVAKGKIEEVGGPAYIASLLDAPAPSNVKYATGVIKDYSVRRTLIQACHEIQTKAYGPCCDIPVLLDESQRKILDLGQCGVTDSFCSMRDLTNQRLDRYAAAKDNKRIPAVPTGFPTIDRLTGGGFRWSKLVIIAARPRIGKTALMLNMARHMAFKRRKVGIFSLEMDKEELDDRWMAGESGVNSMRLINGMDDQEWQRVVGAAEVKAEWPILIDDYGGLTVEELSRRAREMVKMGCEVIFIDQLSKIKCDQKKSAWEANTQNVIAVSHLKKGLKIPVVLLAQVNRKITEAANKRPTLETLKMTGALEEEADIILLGHRDYVYTHDEKDADNAVWEIAKQRQGPEWTVEMKWDAKKTRFYEEDSGYV